MQFCFLFVLLWAPPLALLFVLKQFRSLRYHEHVEVSQFGASDVQVTFTAYSALALNVQISYSLSQHVYTLGLFWTERLKGLIFLPPLHQYVTAFSILLQP